VRRLRKEVAKSCPDLIDTVNIALSFGPVVPPSRKDRRISKDRRPSFD